jgi:ABC-2 type transport system permease protein
MSGVGQVFQKDFKVYFASPIAYIVISIFLILSGVFFFSSFFLYNQAEMRGFFTLLPMVFALVIPAVTMRLFSEELNTGSYELLLTLPVSVQDVVTGKFLSSVAFVVIMLVPTISYAIFISLYGDLDWGPVMGGYFGAILLGAAFSSIGIFASSLTRNQIIAFIIGMAICFGLTLLDKMLFFLPDSMIGVFQFLGADYHFQNVARGILDSRDILYFVSVCFVMLYATYLVIMEKK